MHIMRKLWRSLSHALPNGYDQQIKWTNKATQKNPAAIKLSTIVTTFVSEATVYKSCCVR